MIGDAFEILADAMGHPVEIIRTGEVVTGLTEETMMLVDGFGSQVVANRQAVRIPSHCSVSQGDEIEIHNRLYRISSISAEPSIGTKILELEKIRDTEPDSINNIPRVPG